MASGEPEFRANWTKLVLKRVRELPAPRAELVARAIGTPTLDRVRRAGVFEWLPAAVHLHVTDSIREVISGDARRFWRDLMHMSLSRSLLKPLLEGGLRLFGRSSHSILRMTPQAFSLIARGCGTVGVSRDEAPGSTRLTFDNLPPALCRMSWIEVCAGNCEGVLDYLGIGGEVTTLAELARGRFTVVTTPRG